MTWETILYEKQDGVASLTFNRPDVLNAISPTTPQELSEALEEAESDRDVGCVVLTGAGRAFCAGADVRTFRQMLEGQVEATWIDRLQRVAFQIFNLRKPIIAAINGPALGGGATITLPCDMRIASDQARIGLAFARVGLIPELGSTFLLPRLVGLAKALDLALTGRILDAQEALALGLVGAVIPHQRFRDEVQALAVEIARGPTRVLGLTKEAIHRGLHADLATAIRTESDIIDICRGLPEHREGVTAFLEKRQPRWSEIAGQADT